MFLGAWGKTLKHLTHSIRFLAPFGCFAFSVLSLAFIVGPGDGTWQLYAEQMLQGRRIYADLGLNQQPVFPLLNVISLKLAPPGILYSKAIFVPVAGLYVFMIYRLSQANHLGRLAQALLLLAAFFVSIRFEAFRFDDYHALSGLLALSSLYVSVIFLRGRLALVNFGMLQALATTAAALTRPNDGLALAAAAISVLVLHRRFDLEFAKMAGLSMVLAGTLFLVILACVQETPASWLQRSVIEASAAKGGGALFHYPGLLLANSLEFVRFRLVETAWPYLLLFCAATGTGLWTERHQPRARKLAAAAAVFALLLLLAALKLENLIENLAAMAALAVSAAFVLWTAAVLKGKLAEGNPPRCEPDWSLLAYPFFLFFFGALSTGGKYYGLYPPVALTLLVVATVAGGADGILRKSTTTRAIFVALCAFAGVTGAAFRWNNPYSWLSYNVPSFSGEYLYRNDDRGPRILPAELAELVAPVCATVKPGETMASLPYPFPNYYCGIPPWRGYVQTFFDTSTNVRISQLMDDLKSSPPDFIFYQRQMSILRDHEVLFNHGAALPHRALDALIMARVASGAWTVVYRSAKYPPSDWLLIATHQR